MSSTRAGTAGPLGEPGIATVAHPLVEAATGEAPAGVAAGAVAGARSVAGTADAGAVAEGVDAGAEGVDATDAGAEGIGADAGVADAGAEDADAEVAAADTGAEVADAGTEVADADTGATGTGLTGGVDAGAEAVDRTSAASVDSGSVSADSALSDVCAVAAGDALDTESAPRGSDAEGAGGFGAETAGAGSAATVVESPDDALGEDVSRPASTRAMNFTRSPSTATIAVRKKSLVPIPGTFCCLKLSTSAWLGNESASTSPFRLSTCAV